jgi:hypothetical protein
LEWSLRLLFSLKFGSCFVFFFTLQDKYNNKVYTLVSKNIGRYWNIVESGAKHHQLIIMDAEMFKADGPVGPRGLILTRSGYLLITGGPDVRQKFFNKKVRFRLICTGRDNANIISGSVTVRNWSGNGKLIYRVRSLFINMK